MIHKKYIVPATGKCVYCGRNYIGLTKPGVLHEDETWCLHGKYVGHQEILEDEPKGESED